MSRERRKWSNPDYVTFLTGVDLVLSPGILLLAFYGEFTLGAAVYFSLGKFFVAFIVWHISFFLARKIVKPQGALLSTAGLLSLSIVVLLTLALVFIDGRHSLEIHEWMNFAATVPRILAPTILTYLLLVLRLRWLAKR